MDAYPWKRGKKGEEAGSEDLQTTVRGSRGEQVPGGYKGYLQHRTRQVGFC